MNHGPKAKLLISMVPDLNKALSTICLEPNSQTAQSQKKSFKLIVIQYVGQIQAYFPIKHINCFVSRREGVVVCTAAVVPVSTPLA
jgi:hypothetical protein